MPVLVFVLGVGAFAACSAVTWLGAFVSSGSGCTDSWPLVLLPLDPAEPPRPAARPARESPTSSPRPLARVWQPRTE